MPELVVGDLEREDVQKTLATAKKLLRLGKGLSALTPTELDDKVIETLDRVVSALEPFAQEDVILDIVNFVLDLLKKDEPLVALAKAKEAIA